MTTEEYIDTGNCVYFASLEMKIFHFSGHFYCGQIVSSLERSLCMIIYGLCIERDQMCILSHSAKSGWKYSACNVYQWILPGFMYQKVTSSGWPYKSFTVYAIPIRYLSHNIICIHLYCGALQYHILSVHLYCGALQHHILSAHSYCGASNTTFCLHIHTVEPSNTTFCLYITLWSPPIPHSVCTFILWSPPIPHSVCTFILWSLLHIMHNKYFLCGFKLQNI